MEYRHIPVMTEEVLHYLNPKPGQTIIDGTLGGGGHSQAILKRILPGGKILAIDLDLLAISNFESRKQKTEIRKQITIVQDNFKNLKQIARDQGLKKVNGILLDLGLSSGQLQDQTRGFSFLANGQLDMRFDRRAEVTAHQILNESGQKELTEIFKEFGEEKLAFPIAKKIIELRRMKKIDRPGQLVQIISEVYRKFYRGTSKMNPATKIFQALRIAVNEELDNLQTALPAAITLLAKGGRLAIISYHSLEDRIVKDFFKQESRGCICASTMPLCQCSHKKTLKIITKKPVVPTAQETLENPRARSAKMRVAEKI